MNREDIIRMAREAGFEDGYGGHLFPPGDYMEEVVPVTDEIVRFAALVAAAEREACAKVCEGISKDPWTKVGREHAPYMEATAKDCAETIRKRGEVKP